MTDEQIVELYWQRSEKAIEETDKAYGRYFHYIAYGILQNDEDAKETVNDTYLKAWAIIPPQRPNPLKAFLGRITRQLSINRLESRHAQKRNNGQYALALDELSDCISANGEDLADLTALRDCINRFLRSLPNQQRRIFIRRYWHTHSVSQIAADLHINQSNVKSSLMRSREKLRKLLKEEGLLDD